MSDFLNPRPVAAALPSSISRTRARWPEWGDIGTHPQGPVCSQPDESRDLFSGTDSLIRGLPSEQVALGQSEETAIFRPGDAAGIASGGRCGC